MTVSCKAALVLAFCLVPLAAPAEEIVVSNYGVTTNGMPFAIAMAKGFFKQQGADVTGILSSDGGGTTVRTARFMASRVIALVEHPAPGSAARAGSAPGTS